MELGWLGFYNIMIDTPFVYHSIQRILRRASKLAAWSFSGNGDLVFFYIAFTQDVFGAEMGAWRRGVFLRDGLSSCEVVGPMGSEWEGSGGIAP